MAKKKLNKRFLTILGVFFGGIICLGLAYKIVPHFFPQVKWLIRGTPAAHMATAKSLFDQGQYDKAAEEYKHAIQLKGTPDAPMYTALGDCLMHLVLRDPQNLRIGKVCWDEALSIDPTYLPALQRLLDLFIDDAELNRSTNTAAQWDAVHDAAAKVLAVSSKDHKARVELNRATLQRWMNGVEVDPQQINDAIAALLNVAQENPFDADAQFYAVQAKVFQGQRLMNEHDIAGASDVFSDVLKIIDDTLAAHPDDAMEHFHASQEFRILGSSKRAVDKPPEYLDRVRSEAEKAANLVKKDDPKYLDAKIYYAKILDANGDMAGAEKVFRSLHSERPDDASVRIVLAELIARDPAHRDEAISLLSTIPPQDEKSVAGLQALLSQRYEMTALSNLINIRLDMLPASKDQQDYDAQLKQIDGDYSKLIARPGVADSPSALAIQGRIQLARGQNLQAVQTLDRALKLMPPPASLVDVDQRYKLMLTLASAYTLTEQTGEAKDLLEQVVHDFGNFAPARLMLVQLLLRENNLDEAKVHLDKLNKMMPDSPVVARLTMLTLDPVKDKDQLQKLYQKLPETNRSEIISKAQMAERIGNHDETIRLMEGIRSVSPKDMQTLISLAKLYADNGQKDKAMSLMDEAVAQDPNNPELKILQAQISGSNVGELTQQMIDNEKDPFRKELMSFDLAVQQGKDDEAQQHLQNAAKINPDDGRIQSLLFQIALQQKDFPKAESYIDSLTKKNQDMAGGVLFRVRLAMAKGDLQNANDLAQKLTQTMPEFAQSWVVLGQVQKAQGHYTDALQNFTTALSKQSQNLDAIHGLIDCYYALNDPQNAKQYIERGRQVFPHNAALREAELQHEMTYGDPEKVIGPRQDMLKQAIDQKDPQEPKKWFDLGNAYLVAAMKKNNDQTLLTKARDTFNQALAKFPDEINLLRPLAETCMLLHDFASGEKAIQAMIIRPAWLNKPEPTLMLADYYAKAGKTDQQQKVLKDYLAIAPLTVPVQLRLSDLLAQQGKLDDALKVLDGNADNPDILKERIELQINGGRLADAEKEINAALAATPNPSPVLLTRQAFVYMKSGRTSKALDVLEKVLAADPHNLDAMYLRGTIYVQANKNSDQAQRDLEAVRAAKPDLMPARLLLAETYHQKGDDTSAIRELEDASRTDPTAKAPRLRLIDLYAGSKPPSWSEIDRIIHDMSSQPALANDPDVVLAEMNVLLMRKQADQAKALGQQALAKNFDLRVFRSFCAALLQQKDYRGLLAATDKIVKDKKAPWWVYQMRGQARKVTDDKKAALDEYQAGLDVANAAKDDDAVATIINTIASDIGISDAKVRVLDRAEKGENRWRMMMAYLLQIDNDIPGAISWGEKVLNDPKTTPDDLELAQHVVSTLYLRLDPPDTAKAVTLLRAILDRHPSDPAALNNLACTMILPNSGYTAKDALPYSTQAFNQLQQAGVVDANLYDTQGYILVLNGKVDEGLSLLQQAADKQAFPELLYHLGVAYLALPQPRTDQAQAALEQASSQLDAASKGDKPIDADLKDKIDKALDKIKQSAPATRP